MTAKIASRRAAKPARRTTKRPSRVRERPVASIIYVDASALVKLFLPEPESAAVNRMLAGQRQVIVSDLAVTETTSALARRRREGLLRASAAATVHRKMLETVEAGFVRLVSLDPPVHRQAERLLLAIDDIALRAADALHVALALSAGATVMATYDRRLAAAAFRVGLTNAPDQPQLR